jgi:hypothetical protein
VHPASASMILRRFTSRIASAIDDTGILALVLGKHGRKMAVAQAQLPLHQSTCFPRLSCGPSRALVPSTATPRARPRPALPYVYLADASGRVRASLRLDRFTQRLFGIARGAYRTPSLPYFISSDLVDPKITA